MWSNVLEESTVPSQRKCEWEARQKYLSSTVVYSNRRDGLGPCSNLCGGTSLPFVLVPGPDRVDLDGLVKAGPSPQKFCIGPNCVKGPGLIFFRQAGTTMTHGC